MGMPLYVKLFCYSWTTSVISQCSQESDNFLHWLKLACMTFAMETHCMVFGIPVQNICIFRYIKRHIGLMADQVIFCLLVTELKSIFSGWFMLSYPFDILAFNGIPNWPCRTKRHNPGLLNSGLLSACFTWRLGKATVKFWIKCYLKNKNSHVCGE